jgi:predicted SAM-dependent methyltransferase
MIIEGTKLDLACGNNKKEGYIGIDIIKTDSTDYVFDLLQFPWPIESDTIEEINCSHYMEHIPHDIKNPNDSRDGLIQFMDEMYRVLKVGGKAYVACPYYTSVRAYGDPTHTRYMGEWSFFYFNKEWRQNTNLEHYNIKSNFDMKYSYLITNDLTLRSEEVRNDAFQHDWNAVDDIFVELIKI